MTTKPEMLSRIEATFSQLTPSESGSGAGCWRTPRKSRLKPRRASVWRAGPAGSPSDASCASWGIATRRCQKSLRDPYQPRGMNERLDSGSSSALPNRLQHALSLEVDAITQVYQLAQTDAFRQVVHNRPRRRGVCAGDPVHARDRQRLLQPSRVPSPARELFRRRVRQLGGIPQLRVSHPYVVLTDTRTYSTMARQYRRVASERDPAGLNHRHLVPVGAGLPDGFTAGENRYRSFLGFACPVSCLFNLLLSGVVEALGDALPARLAVNRQLQQEFGQFER